MTEPSFMIAIVNHNTRDELRTCLDSLRPYLGRVVVFDSHSTDGSAAMVRSDYSGASLIESPVNLGYGASANRVFGQHALARDAEVLVLSNSDIVFTPETLHVLVEDLRRNSDAGLTGPRLLNSDGSLQRSCFPLPGSLWWMVDNDAVCTLLRFVPVLRGRLLRLWDHKAVREVPWVKGALLAIRKTAFEDVGGFDESFFMYYEETDLCLRLAKRGWKIRFTPATEVIHSGGASTAKIRTVMAVALFESFMRFARRHYSALHSTLLLYMWKLILLTRIVRDQARVAFRAGTDRSEAAASDLQAWKHAVGFRFRDLEQRDRRSL